MEITIFSNVCIDDNKSEHSSYKSFGSPGMYMGLTLELLSNDRTTVISSYGPDFLPYKGPVSLYPGEPNSDSTLIYMNDSSGPKRIQKALNREESRIVPLDNHLIQIISDSNIIVLAPILPNYDFDYVSKLKEHISNTKMILVPQGYFRGFNEDDTITVSQHKDFEEIMKLFDVMVVSEEDFEETERKSLDWSIKNDIIVIVTKGQNGASVVENGEVTNVKTTPIEDKDVKDSVGAGDIFAAAFAHMWANTGDIHASVRFANSIAGQSLFYDATQLLNGEVEFEK